MKTHYLNRLTAIEFAKSTNTNRIVIKIDDLHLIYHTDTKNYDIKLFDKYYKNYLTELLYELIITYIVNEHDGKDFIASCYFCTPPEHYNIVDSPLDIEYTYKIDNLPRLSSISCIHLNHYTRYRLRYDKNSQGIEILYNRKTKVSDVTFDFYKPYTINNVKNEHLHLVLIESLGNYNDNNDELTTLLFNDFELPTYE